MSNENLVSSLGDLINSLNIMGGKYQREHVVQDVLARTHRTLQQQFVSIVIIPVLKMLAENYRTGNFDLRNQASCRLAQRMLEAVSEDDLNLPLI